MKVFLLICSFLVSCFIIDSVSGDPVQKLDVEIVDNIEERHELDKRQTGTDIGVGISGRFIFPPGPPPTNLHFKKLLLSIVKKLYEDVTKDILRVIIDGIPMVQEMVDSLRRKFNKLDESKDQFEEELQKLAEEELQNIQEQVDHLENGLKFLEEIQEFFQGEVLELLARLQELLKVLCDNFWLFIQNLPELLKLVCDLLDLWEETVAHRQTVYVLAVVFGDMLEVLPRSSLFPMEVSSVLLAEDQRVYIISYEAEYLIETAPTSEALADDVVELRKLKTQLEDCIAIRDAACPCPRLPPIFRNVLQGIRERFDDAVKRLREMPPFEEKKK